MILPELVSSNPIIIRNVVVLPAPFIPSSPNISPGFTVNVFGTDYEGAYVDKQIRKRITTRPVPIIVKQSGDINGVPGAPFSDEINILIMVDEAHTYSEKALRIAEKCEQRVDELEDLVYDKEVFVGGVNILKNSRNIPLYSNDSSKFPISREELQEKERTFFRYRRKNTSLNPYTLSFYNNIYYKDFTENITGRQYTYSFLARAQEEKTCSLMAYVTDPTGGIERIDFSSATETIRLSTNWKRYSLTFTLEQELSEEAIFRFCPLNMYFSEEDDAKTFYLDICEWKVEKGNTATEWTPSLAETDEQITEVKTSLREEFGKIISEVEGTVETLDGKIIKTNKQVQSLESTTSLITSEVYGANVLENSGFHTDAEKWWGYTKDTLDFIDQSAKIVDKNNIILGQSILGKLQPGETYTGSVKVKVVKPSLTGKLQMVDNGAYQGSWFAHQSKDILVGEIYDWTTFQFSFTPNERIKYASEYHFIFTWKNLDLDCEIYFKELKLERGEWATQWSDRPEDNARRYSKIEQTAEGLTSTVGDLEADLNTKIEQTASKINTSVTNLEKGLNSKIEQTAEDLTVKIGETSNLTNYLNFSEKGLIVGNNTAEVLKGNVRIFDEGIEIRDGNDVFASFSKTEIKLGAIFGNETGSIVIGNNWGKIYGQYIRNTLEGGEYLCIEADDLVYLTGQCGVIQRSTFEEKGKKYTSSFVTQVATNIRDAAGLGKELRPALRNEFIGQVTKENEIGRSGISIVEIDQKPENSKIQLSLFSRTFPDVNLPNTEKKEIKITPERIYYCDEKITNEGTDILTPLHYKKGDSFTVSWTGAGFITSDKTHIHFCIPISKLIPKGLVPIITSELDGGLVIRQDKKYLYGSASASYVKPAKYVARLDNDNNFIRVYAEFSMVPTEPEITNNETCGVQASLKITFE